MREREGGGGSSERRDTRERVGREGRSGGKRDRQREREREREREIRPTRIAE